MSEKVKRPITGRASIQVLRVPKRLLTLNEYIDIERGNRYAAAKAKKGQEMIIASYIKAQKIEPVTRPVILEYTWTMKTKRMDKDNISFAQKFIQDALVKTGILPNDGWNDIVGFSHSFVHSKSILHDHVAVRIIEQ